MTSWTSTSAPTPLLNLGVLQSWVHRPQALAKCSISDVYGMRALVKGNEGLEVSVGYSSRGGFRLLLLFSIVMLLLHHRFMDLDKPAREGKADL